MRYLCLRYQCLGSEAVWKPSFTWTMKSVSTEGNSLIGSDKYWVLTEMRCHRHHHNLFDTLLVHKYRIRLKEGNKSEKKRKTQQ